MRCVSADHYFSAEPDAPSDYRRVEFEVAGITYRLATAGGVFSADRLDPGTAVLLGKAELHAMLLRWLPRLMQDGRAWLVVARHLGADSLQQWLTDRGWSVTRHASQKGYRVLRVDGKPDDAPPWRPENG